MAETAALEADLTAERVNKESKLKDRYIQLTVHSCTMHTAEHRMALVTCAMLPPTCRFRRVGSQHALNNLQAIYILRRVPSQEVSAQSKLLLT